ncbi:hypothetical protein D9M71_763370 [compost metagenome]
MFHKYKKLPEHKWRKKYKELSSILEKQDDQRGGIAVLTDKYEKWAYEQEFRLVDGEKPGLKKFNPGCLRTITFGLRTSDQDKETIINICKNSEKTHVQFFQAQKLEGVFQLDIAPYKE